MSSDRKIAKPSAPPEEFAQSDGTKYQTPEEQELSKKLSDLDKLLTELTQRELDLVTLQTELRIFEAKYLRIVGVRYAELDEILARIAEAEAIIRPNDKETQEKAKQARTQAAESAQATKVTKEIGEKKFKPSESLKKLYRQVAKSIHPDLAVDEKDRIRLQKLMADVNLAYEEGDEARLRDIFAEWESSPESVKGEGIAVDLVRVIRRIAQGEKRHRTIEAEIVQIKESDLYKLKTKVEDAENDGRDLLAEMALRVAKEVTIASERLAEITRKKVQI
jgi:hypothetical protein